MENKKPTINVLTRTSNRPNGFKKNVENVRNQTYDNINHIICTDDENSIQYIKECGISDFIFIDREKMIKEDTSVKQNNRFLPHNLYFNEMVKHVEDGWVIYLDDDDTFISLDTVQKIVDEINKVDEDTIIYWRMVYSNGQFLPLDMSEGKEPLLSGIGGSCFTFNVKYKDEVRWDSWSCSDFRVIKHLDTVIPKRLWVPEIFIFVPSIGLGYRRDIK